MENARNVLPEPRIYTVEELMILTAQAMAQPAILLPQLVKDRVIGKHTGLERLGCCRKRLEIWRFRLDQSHHNFLRARKLILVKNVVFGCSAVHPRWPVAFNQDPTSRKDIDWILRFHIEIMICGPCPHVLEVSRSGRSNTKQ